MDRAMGNSDVFQSSLKKGLSEAVAAFASRGVDYALIGGIAASFRSQPRFTKDIDFLLRPTQLALPGLLEDLRSRGFELDVGKLIGDWNRDSFAVFSYGGIRIDWLKPILPLYSHVLNRATDVEEFGQTIRVATVEGLILLKLLAFRDQDLMDIKNLVAFHKATLDLEWIRSEWTAIADLDDPRMKKFEEIVGR